jgi:hypothetical protein
MAVIPGKAEISIGLWFGIGFSVAAILVTFLQSLLLRGVRKG